MDLKQNAWRDRLRSYLETTDTLTGQVVNGAIVLLIFLSVTRSLERSSLSFRLFLDKTR